MVPGRRWCQLGARSDGVGISVSVQVVTAGQMNGSQNKQMFEVSLKVTEDFVKLSEPIFK